MGGTLVATDTAGGGLTMTVTLPAVPLPALPALSAPVLLP
jgi:signal transduction histidine kinase